MLQTTYASPRAHQSVTFARLQHIGIWLLAALLFVGTGVVAYKLMDVGRALWAGGNLPASVQAATGFPDLFGMRKPVTYLLLFQNNHELRGTGGFISAVGELQISRGKIESLTSADSYTVFDERVIYPPAPAPIQRYLKAEILVFRDANWSPDLPTSARTALQLYELSNDSDIDGVVTIDLDAVRILIDALDGIQIEGVETTITGDNVVEIIKQLWGNPLGTEQTLQSNQGEWWRERKDFIPVLAEAMLERIKSGKFNPLAIVTAGTTALKQRSVQIWLKDPAGSKQLAELGWDGSLHTVSGSDFVGLVDANVGFNKVNAAVTRTLDYAVTWPDSGPGVAVATVTYTHPVDKPEVICDPSPRYGSGYDDMIARCFFNYVRLYVPRGSKLISIEGVDESSITSQRGEARTQVLAAFFSMNAGETHTVRFTYELPASLQAEGYQLILQRQAGTGPLPITLTVGDAAAYSETFTDNWLEWSPKN